MSVAELILIKLGGSLITDKAGHEVVRSQVIARLASELRQVVESSPGGVVLGHGSGSFGHAEASKGGWSAKGSRPSTETLVRTQDAAARLHREVVAALLEAGLAPFSLAPSSLMTSSKGRLSNLNIEPLIEAIGSGLLPVLFGDVVLDRDHRATIYSTENVFLSIAPPLLARGHRISAAYWLGNTDGVLDSSGETIARISQANAGEVVRSLLEGRNPDPGTGQSSVLDVTGGMTHRVESALAFSRLGVPSWILNGFREGLLPRVVRGEEVRGTYVAPA